MKIDYGGIAVLVSILTVMFLALFFTLADGPRGCFCRVLTWSVRKVISFFRVLNAGLDAVGTRMKTMVKTSRKPPTTTAASDTPAAGEAEDGVNGAVTAPAVGEEHELT